MDIFEKLQQAREHKRISWAEWAKLSDLSEMGLRKMFKNRSLSVENMEKLCGALDIPVYELYEPVHSPGMAMEPEPGYSTPIRKIERIETLLQSLKQDFNH